MKLTQKQENFCINIFKGMSQRQAYLDAGYSSKQLPRVMDSNACRLAKSNNVVARLTELHKASENAAISTVEERKKILTEIQRAKISDFVDSWGNLDIKDKETLKTAAVAEIRTEKTLVGIRTTLKLRDPVSAIAEHNKMEKIYAPENSERESVKVQVNVLNIDAKSVAAAILEANRLGLTPGMVRGNGHSEDATLLSSPANVQTTPVPESKN